jgi:hypothetical protein
MLRKEISLELHSKLAPEFIQQTLQEAVVVIQTQTQIMIKPLMGPLQSALITIAIEQVYNKS